MNQKSITIMDATPMVADVISGSTARPEPWRDGPWWHWATKTHAGRRALEWVGCTVDPDHPWHPGAGNWRLSPYVGEGEAHEGYSYAEEVGELRLAIGVPLAGVFFGERCWLDFRSVEYQRANQFLVAINEDGTRAAVANVTEIAREGRQ